MTINKKVWIWSGVGGLVAVGAVVGVTMAITHKVKETTTDPLNKLDALYKVAFDLDWSSGKTQYISISFADSAGSGGADYSRVRHFIKDNNMTLEDAIYEDIRLKASQLSNGKVDYYSFNKAMVKNLSYDWF